MWVFSPKRQMEPIKRPAPVEESAVPVSAFVEPEPAASDGGDLPADGFIREDGEIVGDIYGRYQKSEAQVALESTVLDELQRFRVRSHREMEAAKAAALGNARGEFIETEDGFLRLEAVQRFEVTEPYAGKWRVDAYVDQFVSVKVGMFESEKEARAAVIRMIEV